MTAAHALDSRVRECTAGHPTHVRGPVPGCTVCLDKPRVDVVRTVLDNIRPDTFDEWRANREHDDDARLLLACLDLAMVERLLPPQAWVWTEPTAARFLLADLPPLSEGTKRWLAENFHTEGIEDERDD